MKQNIYHISKPYKMKSLQDFQSFSDDILYKPHNRSLYKKSVIFLIVFYSIIILFSINSLVLPILLFTLFNDDEHYSLLRWIIPGTWLFNFIPLIIWMIYNLTTVYFWDIDWSSTTDKIKRKKIGVPGHVDLFNSFWHVIITKWCRPGLLDVTTVQVLTMFNKLEEKDKKYIFKLIMKEKNVNQIKFNFDDDKKMMDILNKHTLSKKQLNLIYGLITTLKYVNINQTFVIDNEADYVKYSDRSIKWWWLLRIDPTLTLFIVLLLFPLTMMWFVI